MEDILWAFNEIRSPILLIRWTMLLYVPGHVVYVAVIGGGTGRMKEAIIELCINQGHSWI